MTVTKRKGGSLEFLGEVRLGDELKFNEGTTIIGPGARVLPGPPSTQIVGPEAVLELQSGAHFGKHSPTNSQDILVHGELRAGSPTRPITRDATLGLNAKEPVETKIDLDLALKEGHLTSGMINRVGKSSIAGPDFPGYSLAVSAPGKMRIHSADPAKARLVLKWNGVRRQENPEGAHRVVLFFFSEDLLLDGVHCDDFRKGGLHVLDESVPARWKHVTYGDRNEGRSEELLTLLRRN
jgi:hypothetical protein